MDNRHGNDETPAFEQIDIASLWSVQGNRHHSLLEFENALFTANASIGGLLVDGPLQLLRLWPHQCYLISESDILPAKAMNYETLITDISDACSGFQLSGGRAFAFARDYLSAELPQPIADAGCLRCRLGQYVVMLWWQDSSRLNFLVERSYAQSFAEYIKSLMARWRPETP